MSNATAAALAQFPDDWPDLEYAAGSDYVGVAPDASQYASIAFTMVAPLSRGSVSISSADNAVQPVINPGLLSDPVDQAVAIAAFKRIREIFATKAIQPVLVGPEAAPGNSTVTDSQIMQFIRATTTTIFHASCTCKMGKQDDPMAVVDSKGKVFGVGKLRVVDASAFALLPPGHAMSTVYALAEKIAADIIAGN